MVDSFSSLLGFGGGTSAPETPDSLAMQAMEDYNRANYSDALKTFGEIKERYPFSPQGLLAELKSADCQYYLGNFAEAIAEYEGFEANHPTNEAIPYVLFQIAMSSYKQIDTIDRDPGAAIDAIAAFLKLIKAFPNSAYVVEANARVLAARNFLANHEFYIATYYIRTESLPLAEARLRYLLANYPETTVAAEAQTIIAAIAAGNPPERTWKDWIPDISLPDWHTFTSIAPGTGASPPPQ
jgi:outer membrane protein assembly factor BamD